MRYCAPNRERVFRLAVILTAACDRVTGIWGAAVVNKRITWREVVMACCLAAILLAGVFVVPGLLSVSGRVCCSSSPADLREASLEDSRLTAAILTGAHLQGANLRRADFSGADLRGASLAGAITDETVFTGAQADAATTWHSQLDPETRRELRITETGDGGPAQLRADRE